MKVRVPASSSNLGSGFDCVGIAVDRWLTAAITLGAAGGTGVTVRRAGRLAELELAPEDDLLYRGFRAACEARGVQWAGSVAFAAESDIPVGRGLGSSAAAAVAGALLADAALGLGLPGERIVAIATAIEGHPDNVAPAVYGGAVLSVPAPGSGELRSTALAVSPAIEFVIAIPPFASDTRAARAALPAQLPHHDAVVAAGRAAALVQGLATGDGDLLAAALDDVLHVPFRRAGIPGYDAVVAAARGAGAYGATLSGAGSAILAVAPLSGGDAVGKAMLQAWAAAGVTAELLSFARPAGGAVVYDALGRVADAPRATPDAR